MTETKALTLTEFLTARIDEDEEAARDSSTLYGQGSSLYINRHNPTHVLAECEAKRGIVKYAVECEDEWSKRLGDRHGRAEHDASQWAVSLLAAVYADHPDYDPEWRP